MPPFLRRLLATLLLLAPASSHAADAGGGAAIALIDFQYLDTSGEPRDQRAEHETRVKALMTALAQDISAHERFRLVTPRCTPQPCTFADGAVPDLAAAARQAGADLLLVGGIHKMSTLVQWAKVEVIDLRTDRIVFEKLISFRGDSDDAWQRAEAFIARQLLALPPS